MGCLLLLVSPLNAGISLTGYYKQFFTGFWLPAYRNMGERVSTPAEGMVQSRLRLDLKADLGRGLQFETAWDLSPQIAGGDFSAGFDGDLQMSSYRAGDLERRLYPDPGQSAGSLTLTHNLDRLFFTFHLDFADVYVGRQAISWGSGHFVNPTDIIAPFTFNELDVEDRRGVDAVRIRIPVGSLDELDFGYVAGENFKGENSAWFARGKFYLFHTDVSLLVMDFQRHLMLGIDLTRALGGAGVWLEGAHVIPGFFSNTASETDPYTRLSAGLDYNFAGGWYTFFEYHFNSAGASETVRYPDIFRQSGVAEGAVYLMGRHYLNAGLVYQLHPLIPVTAMVICNAGDGSVVFAPSAEYNIRENVYLVLGAYLGIGDSYEMVTDPGTGQPTPALESEFGAYPDLLYTAFRIYF